MSRTKWFCAMRLAQPVISLVYVTLLPALLACGDSTGPTQAQEAARLAAHFDQLYLSLAAKTTSPCTSGYYGEISCSLVFAELPAAYGATPLDVRVTTPRGTETWHGTEISDSVYYAEGTEFWIVAYSDSNLRDFLIVGGGAGTLGAAQLFQDTTFMYSTDGEFQSTSTPVTGSCATPRALANPDMSMYETYSCTPARFTSSLTVNFAGQSTPMTISIAPQQFSGESFRFDSSSASIGRRVRAFR